MKAFEKWHERFKVKSFNAYWHRKAGWVSALRWVLKQVDKSNSDGSIIDYIKEELKTEDD